MEVYVLPRFRHRTSTAEDEKLKESAFILPAAFADTNIATDGPVYCETSTVADVLVVHTGLSAVSCFHELAARLCRDNDS
jgi:hypothetical protein